MAVMSITSTAIASLNAIIMVMPSPITDARHGHHKALIAIAMRQATIIAIPVHHVMLKHEKHGIHDANPRWQSRPAAQRDSCNRREQNDFQSQPGQPGHERYKGDYERFNDTEDKPRFAGRPSLRYDRANLAAPKPKSQSRKWKSVTLRPCLMDVC